MRNGTHPCQLKESGRISDRDEALVTVITPLRSILQILNSVLVPYGGPHQVRCDRRWRTERNTLGNIMCDAISVECVECFQRVQQ
jgi:hypothetical protein